MSDGLDTLIVLFTVYIQNNITSTFSITNNIAFDVKVSGD